MCCLYHAVISPPVSGGVGEWEVSLCQTTPLLSSMKILCECKVIGAIALIRVYIHIAYVCLCHHKSIV